MWSPHSSLPLIRDIILTPFSSYALNNPISIVYTSYNFGITNWHHKFVIATFRTVSITSLHMLLLRTLLVHIGIYIGY